MFECIKFSTEIRQMVTFSATIRKFGKMGEKTGWVYVEVPAGIADQLKPGNRRSFRVKGKLDACPIHQVALLPMGGGRFILVLNASLRKQLRKKEGAMLKLVLEPDETPFSMNADLIACLEDEPPARAFFQSLPASHQRYFSKWIDDAKTIGTKTQRIANSVDALSRRLGFGEMLRERKKRS